MCRFVYMANITAHGMSYDEKALQQRHEAYNRKLNTPQYNLPV